MQKVSDLSLGNHFEKTYEEYYYYKNLLYYYATC